MLKAALSALLTPKPSDPVPSEGEGNSMSSHIEVQNARSLRHISSFRENFSAGKATHADFSKQKQENPYFGFVPCHARDIDFVMFHANDDIVAWEYLWFGADHYEKEIVRTWVEWCRKPGLIYDIGAYTGLMSILAALAHPRNKVHLFEPMDRTVERAKINIKANGINNRVELHNKAASDSVHEAVINLYREENFLGTGNSIYDKDLPILATKKIDCVVVDDHLNGLKPTIIKIDVEGHEKACIEGMRKTIERAKPKMIVEVWEHTREEVLSLLSGFGYECTPFEKQTRRVMNYRCVPKS